MASKLSYMGVTGPVVEAGLFENIWIDDRRISITSDRWGNIDIRIGENICTHIRKEEK